MENEIQIKTLKQITKQVISRIKEVQTEIKDCYTQEDVWIKQGIERELIQWKISLEKWTTKLKNEINE